MIEIDPFEGLVLNYSGISPFCSVNFNNANCNKEAQKYVSYCLEKDLFANGDTVVVHATIDENITKELGYVIATGKGSFEYLCENMPYYLESLDGVDLTFLESELRDAVKASISFESQKSFYSIDSASFFSKYGSHVLYDSKFASFVDVINLKSNESYLLTIKEIQKDEFVLGEIEPYNSLQIISTCCATVSTSSEQANGNIYLSFKIKNIVVYPDGTLKWGVDSEYMFYYESTMDSLDAIKNRTVWAFSDNYNIQQLEKNDWLDF